MGAIPKLSRHKATNQGRVTIDGVDYYLGQFGTPECQARYDNLISNWLACGRQQPKKKDTTVSDLADAFTKALPLAYSRNGKLTTQGLQSKRIATIVKQKFGPLKLTDFNQKQTKELRDTWVSKNARRTVKNYLSIIKNMFSFAYEKDLINYEKLCEIREVKISKLGKQPRQGRKVLPIPQNEIETILSSVSNKDREDYFRVLALTGARPSEILQLKNKSLLEKAKLGQVTLETHKTSNKNKERTILFGPKARAILQGCNPAKWPQSSSVYFHFKKACKAVKADYHPYQLRHSFATACREKFGIETTSALLGHSFGLAITNNYARESFESARKAIEEIG